VLNEFWNGLKPGAKRGFAAGVLVVVSLTTALGYWAMHKDYDILFGGLSPRDAAAMTEELDHLKQPYRLAADGTTILVDKAAVPATRLKLMSKDIPLHGAVGFELFNNSDFGMTEFAQKINYQRALQGELTRTIVSLQEVESARVHIAFPEEALFKRDEAKAKASVTLTTKPGQTLRPDQVSGIQRLVAASVTGISPSDVTVINEHGVALTHAGAGDGADGGIALSLKHDVEQALMQKAAAVLDKALGAGRAVVSVDATLNLDQVRVTQEDVTHPPAHQDDAPAGVVVRQTEITRDDAAGDGTDGRAAPGPATLHRETEYQVGRRVQQIVSQPGSITRLQVVAVVQSPLTPAQLDQMRAIVSASVGASTERGDVVVVQSVAAITPVAPVSAAAPAIDLPPVHTAATGSKPEVSSVGVLSAALALVACAVLAFAIGRRGRRAVIPMPPRTEPLTDADRQAALRRLREWLATEPAASLEPAERANAL